LKEIEVILDMRPSPDSPEFILVKQKLAAEGDRLMLVGEPHEQRVEVGGPRVTIQLAERADHQVGFVNTAKVRNVGMSPIEVSGVAVVFAAGKLTPGETLPTGPSSYKYEPLEPVAGPLYPGHVRTYYLPMSLYDAVLYQAKKTPPSGFWVAGFVGEAEVGRCEGKYLQPFLDRGMIQYERRAEIALDSLHEAQRFRILRRLFDFASEDFLPLNKEDLKVLDPAKNVYLVKVMPGYSAVVARLDANRILLMDVVSEESLKQYKAPSGAGGSQG
jgi:hypothetical protein